MAAAALLRSFGDIIVGRTGKIDASGGHGAGGEVVGNSTFSGAGGGGSGGAVILQAAGEIRIEADPGHKTPFYRDSDGDDGASIDVSGGRGFDVQPSSTGNIFALSNPRHEWTRSDGGHGGFGLIQLQAGSTGGAPVVEQGAFLFAEQRLIAKLGPWTGDPDAQEDSPSFGSGTGPLDVYRYIDMLHWRYFVYEPEEPQGGLRTHRWLALNGSIAPIIQPDPTVPATEFQLDTKMMEHFGRLVVQEIQPEKIMACYAGFDEETFQEKNVDPDGPDGPLAPIPGATFDESAVIPMSVFLNEPDGTPILASGQLSECGDLVDPLTDEFEPTNLIDRLPVVPQGIAPVEFGTSSRATSVWLDFNGVALRSRDEDGTPPPLFSPFHGTYNGLFEAIPPGQEGQVKATGIMAETQQAKKVDNTAPLDPGLFGDFTGVPPFNDVSVESPELALQDVVTNNASVTILFQGAHPVRAGSHVPDPATLTTWTSKLRDLSGYALVRFQVTFDLGSDTASFPFGADSFRPAMDTLRLRTSY